MSLPEIGDMVTSQWAKELCRHYDLTIWWIESRPTLSVTKNGSLMGVPVCLMN